MKLEMICTGEEVLAGQIIDTNAAWVANELMDQGIEMQHRITVGDRLNDLASAFIERSHHADVIIVNGGLGPTSDDLSAEAMAQAKGETLVENTEWRQRLETWFSNNNRPMPANNLKQAMLPESAIMVDNPVGTACGFRVKLNRAWLFFTPGVPSELKVMIKDQLLPFIEQEFGNSEPTKVTKMLTIGAGESWLAEQIQEINLPEGISLGYRSSAPYIEIKVFARGKTAINQLDKVCKQIKACLSDLIVTTNIPSLPQAIHEQLIQQQKTLALAESCTGGMIAEQLIALSGSSQYLQHAVVSYSNESKQALLNVNAATLEQFGAVSCQTAEEMAIGARQILDSDFALATSGIAGPSGGSEDKPIGTVAIALAHNNGVYSQLLQFPKRSRTIIRQLASAVAYDMLRRNLENKAVIVNYPSYIKRN
ncbi:CinA family nicotinamide mononucleotide deamidase-related protein [Parashewanella curva]|uniref:CinA-like protein n=1 Tax=Parashewanella curva TaxID=2338552 RepID=A0A3L8PW31_9GAMM|nr:CinA family nicotinamide mononucleotide deamidase-related protein [Parashewanella curva]RLV58999.1 CinA family nicotinamide mononucleotide deamidase-related protein [Parashewanella curva]